MGKSEGCGMKIVQNKMNYNNIHVFKDKCSTKKNFLNYFNFVQIFVELCFFIIVIYMKFFL